MKTTAKAEFEKLDSFGVGSPNDGFAQYFKGNSYLKPLSEPSKCPVFLANVTFEPGAAITGIFIMQNQVAVRFSSAPPERVGIRKKEKKQSA